MTLLVLLLAAGPFLFIAPSAYACPPPPPEKGTLIIDTIAVDTTPVNGEIFVDTISEGFTHVELELDPGTYDVTYGDVLGYVTPPGDSAIVVSGEETHVIGEYIPKVIIENVPPTVTVTLQLFVDPPDDNIGDTWEITSDQIIYIGTELWIQLLIPVNERFNQDELSIVYFGLAGDVNQDGIVNGQDIKLIANVNKNHGYIWGYDLNGDGDVNEEDIHIASSTKKGPQWIELTTIWDGGIYLRARMPHFSGWGIRR
jgi:hypothetical protein